MPTYPPENELATTVVGTAQSVYSQLGLHATARPQAGTCSPLPLSQHVLYAEPGTALQGELAEQHLYQLSPSRHRSAGGEFVR